MNIISHFCVCEDDDDFIICIEPSERGKDIYKITLNSKNDVSFYIKLTDEEFNFARYHLNELLSFFAITIDNKSLYIKTVDSNYPDRADIKEFTDITNIEQVVHYMDIYLHKENHRVSIGDNQYIEIYVDDVKRLKEGIIK